MKAHRFLLFLMMVIILFTALSENASGAEKYVSVIELRNTVPSVWCETYTTHWRDVSVNVSIEVPVVDAVPIICVRMMPALSDEALSDWQDIAKNRTGYLTANLRKDDYLKNNERPAAIRSYSFNQTVDTLPQNMTTSPDDAVNLALQLARDLFNLPADSLALQQTTVLDCVYTYTRKKNEILLGNQVSETGSYLISFTQLFAGIPMKDGLSCYADYGNSAETILHTPVFSVSVDDMGCRKVRAALFSTEAIVADDVPLIPFEKAKNLFEDEIRAGRLRSVDEVRLCYVPYLDKKDKNLIWFCPAWYLVGAYTRDARDEYAPVMNDDTGEMLGDGMDHRALIVDAQSGKLLDFNAKGKTRRIVSPIVTWNDVRR